MKITSKLNALAFAIAVCGLLTCSLCILAFYSFALPPPINEGLTFVAYLEKARHIYYVLYQFRAPVMLLLASVPLLALWGTQRCLTCPELARRVLAFASASAACYLAFTAIAYLVSPAFYDHVESTSAVKAILGAAGKPLYTALDDPDVINSSYGPALHAMNMMFMTFVDDPITACKLRGFVCALASFGLMAYLLFKRFSTTVALFNSFIFLVALMLFSFFSFGTRADSLLIPAAACVCLGTTLKNRKQSIVLISLGVGILIHTKFHAVIFVLPSLTYVLATRGIRYLLPTIPLTGILILIPFFWSETFSGGQYLALITTNSEHYFYFVTACENFAFALLIITPLLGLRFLLFKAGNTRLDKPVSIAFWVLICCMIMVCIAGSMGGAWYYYLMPFLPAIMLLQGQMIESSRNGFFTEKGTEWCKRIAARLLFAWTLVTITTGAAHQMRVLYCVTDYSATDVRADINEIKKAHPHQPMAMGYGKQYSDPLVNLRPLLAKDTPYVYLDHNTYSWYLDHNVTEIGERSYDRIRDHDYDLFLIPKGQDPFSDPMFHPSRSRYREVFLESYRLDYTSRYFGIWKPKASTP